MNVDKPAIVIDNGSYSSKVGFVGDYSPRKVFRTVVGCPREEELAAGTVRGTDNSYVGDEALKRRDFLNLRYPVERGIITNWDGIEQIWHHTFHDVLRVTPDEHAVLLTEKPRNPKENREKMAQIMFETFNTPAVFVAVQAVLSLYSTGRTVGLVLDSGDGATHSVPVFEGFPLNYSILSHEVAGSDVTDYLMKLLNIRGNSFTTPADRDTVRDIKEKLAFVANKFDDEMDDAVEENYQLPDGQVISIGSDRFRAAEALFQPGLVGGNSLGIQGIVVESVTNCRVTLRKSLYENIVLCGGNTLLPGTPRRLHKEIVDLAPVQYKVKIESPPERKETVWIGGSILGSLPGWKPMWISKAEYEEIGFSVVHGKCF